MDDVYVRRYFDHGVPFGRAAGEDGHGVVTDVDGEVRCGRGTRRGVPSCEVETGVVAGGREGGVAPERDGDLPELDPFHG